MRKTEKERTNKKMLVFRDFNRNKKRERVTSKVLILALCSLSAIFAFLYAPQTEAQTEPLNPYMIYPIPLKEEPHKKSIDDFILF